MQRLSPGTLSRLIAAAILVLLLAVSVGSAQDGVQSDVLQESLKRERERAAEQKKEVLRLSDKERDLFSDLAGVEEEIDELTRNIRTMESEASALNAGLDALEGKIADASEKLQNTADKARGLLKALWPLHITTIHGGGLGPRAAAASGPEGSWQDSDRRYQWTSLLFRDAGQTLSQAARHERELETAYERRRVLRDEAEAKLTEVNAAKDELLPKKLGLLHNIQEVRAELLSEEERMERILGSIADLDYRLKNRPETSFAKVKGKLAKPVPLKISVQPSKKHRGVGFKTADGAIVKSVYWGKVVHNDILRGWGRVVILLHDGDYYTLYAYLSESELVVGREVEKGEVVGKTGFYPAVKGPGLYFELRSGQKAVNPTGWFASS